MGRYVVGDDGARLEVVSRPGPLARFGLCTGRSLLRIPGPSEVGEVRVSRRQLRGPEAKRPWTARPWQVRVIDRHGEPLARPFQFRREPEAERFAELVRRFGARG